jgi:hypothetical protein
MNQTEAIHPTPTVDKFSPRKKRVLASELLGFNPEQFQISAPDQSCAVFPSSVPSFNPRRLMRK